MGVNILYYVWLLMGLQGTEGEHERRAGCSVYLRFCALKDPKLEVGSTSYRAENARDHCLMTPRESIFEHRRPSAF